MPDCPVSEANLVNVTGLPVAVRWLLAVVVVLISGFFAGMTLGIMGLDKVGLQIVATAGDTEKERRHARELKGAECERRAAGRFRWGEKERGALPPPRRPLHRLAALGGRLILT